MKNQRPESHPRHILFALRHVSREAAVFVAVCFVLGIAAGAGAFLLKSLTAWISGAVTSGLDTDGTPWRLLWLPLAGIVAAGCFQRYIMREPLDHGTDRINEALTARRHYIPFSATFGSIIGASMTLGLGGSAGSEGPIAYAGAAMGSRLGRFLKLNPDNMALLIAIGGGAGIAGIFKAPVGGLLFVVEVLSVSLTTHAVVGLAAACLAAGFTAYALSGFTPEVPFIHVPLTDWRLVAWALPVGIVCGFYSLYYSWVMTRLTHLLEAIRRPWVKWLLSGAAISAMVFSLPALFGEGYQVIGRILAGAGATAATAGSWIDRIGGLSAPAALMLVAASVAVVKAAAAAVTNSGGGVAGDFAPTIFAGAAVGFFLSLVAPMWGPTAVIPAAALVFMAMGGVMAGAVRAPLMAMFIVVEMTAAYGLFLPLAISSVASYLVVFACRKIHRHAEAARA